MALAHKGLAVETVPWRLTEKDKLPQPNAGRVPVIVDGDRVLHDSAAIADYLEEQYPDRPALFGGETGRGLARFVQNWTETVLHPGIMRSVLLDIHRQIGPQDQAYFRSDREKRFGVTLEEFVGDREARLPAFRASLDPLRRTVERRISFPATLPPMPTTSCSVPFNGPGQSAISNCSRPMIRSAPGAGACSISTTGWRAVPPLTAPEP
jgi:hypothetical protein